MLGLGNSLTKRSIFTAVRGSGAGVSVFAGWFLASGTYSLSGAWLDAVKWLLPWAWASNSFNRDGFWLDSVLWPATWFLTGGTFNQNAFWLDTEAW